MAKQLEDDWLKLKNQARFIQEVIDGVIVLSGRKKADLLKQLVKRNYLRIPPKQKDVQTHTLLSPTVLTQQFEENSEDTEDEATESEKDYDYLLNMKLWSLTQERVIALEVLPTHKRVHTHASTLTYSQKKLAMKRKELDELLSISPAELWDEDLVNFILNWDKFAAMMQKLDDGMQPNIQEKPRAHPAIRTTRIWQYVRVLTASAPSEETPWRQKGQEAEKATAQADHRTCSVCEKRTTHERVAHTHPVCLCPF